MLTDPTQDQTGKVSLELVGQHLPHLFSPAALLGMMVSDDATFGPEDVWDTSEGETAPELGDAEA